MKNEMGGELSTYGGELHMRFWWGNSKERNHLKDPDVNGRTILKWILRK